MASALTSASFGAFSMPSQSALSLLAFRKPASALSSASRSTASSPLARHEIVGERVIVHLALAIGRQHRRLAHDAEARDAGQFEQIASVAGLGELGDAAGAADLVEVRLFVRAGMRGVGLDHADQPMAVGKRIIDHRQIARLENIQRHLPARQQQRAGQRKHRNHVRQFSRSRDRPHSSAFVVLPRPHPEERCEATRLEGGPVRVCRHGSRRVAISAFTRVFDALWTLLTMRSS